MKKVPHGVKWSPLNTFHFGTILGMFTYIVRSPLWINICRQYYVICILLVYSVMVVYGNLWIM